jgi:flagellar hook-associated protein 3 FlgL
MRVDPDLYATVSASMQQVEQTLQTAVTQLSTGKRVSMPSDDPVAFAGDLQSVAASTAIDTFTKNTQAVMTQAQMADAALSSVVTSLTNAISLGTEGGNGTVTSAQRASLAQQVQALLSSVVSQANTTSNGAALFAGTAGTPTPFIADASSSTGYTYQGNSNSNQTQVGTSLAVTVNMPGDQIFTNASGNVLGSLQSMITALQSGSTADVASATSAISTAIAHVDQVRAVYGSTVNQLTAENDYLSQETVSLTSQQQSLVDIDTATAATNLTQAQTAQSAVLAMAAKILPTSLLNYLQN